MKTITKTKKTPDVTYNTLHTTRPNGYEEWRFPNKLIGDSHTITYPSGPKRDESGKLIWKPCQHVWSNSGSRYLGFGKGKDYWDETQEAYYYVYDNVSRPKAGEWNPDTVKQCLDQLDLNCKDSVMAYSGVIQAIPLFGSVMKLNSILRKLAKEMPKKWAKQPFTTTLQWCISADFIDRFVISPTLDDARKWHNACNYVINVLETIRSRQYMPFALKSEDVVTTSDSTSSFSINVPYTGHMYGSVRKRTRTTSKAFLYLSAKYDEALVSPIQLWATRTGITRPLDSAWDLVPFSFVADYFFRTGDWIEGLSEELASQEGLRGKIAEIHSLWGSVKTETTYEFKPEGISPAWYWYLSSRAFSPETLSSGTYERFPISQPGTFINLLSHELGDYFDVQLTRTRVRTLAELIAQYKLR